MFVLRLYICEQYLFQQLLLNLTSKEVAMKLLFISEVTMKADNETSDTYYFCTPM